MSAAASPLLDVNDLSAHYGHVQALKPTSLHIAEGELVTILGPNGAGKSTLLRAITQLTPGKGRVMFRGEDITGLPTHRRAALGIIMVPEGRGLFGQMSVRENLILGAYQLDNAASVLRQRLDQVFALFPRLKERLDQLSSSLSGGEQQMLAIGRALMMQPKILILDEPTLGLAPVILELLSKALEKLRQTTPITVLLGEQNVTFALPHADRVYVLEHARIVWEGDPGRFAAEAGEGYL